MVRSETGNDKGTAPAKPVRKIWTTGSISASDKDYVEWLGRQPSTFRARGTVYGMNLYVNQLNVESQMVYERQLKEYKERLHSSEPVDAGLSNEPGRANVPEGIGNVPEHRPPLSLEQILAQSQEQIPLQPSEQTLPQSPEHLPPSTEQSLPPSTEQSLPLPPGTPLQNSPTLRPPRFETTTAVPTTPVTQSSDQARVEQRAGANLNANRLTMEQALELFELMQARRSADVGKAPTVEALHVEVAPRRAEPLSFMTLQTVEGIVGSMEFCTPQGQTSWESKMEKFLNLGHAYSSGNTVTGEKCYMVDEALYRDILLAVAAMATMAGNY